MGAHIQQYNITASYASCTTLAAWSMPPLHGNHYNYDVAFLQQISCHTATCLVHAIVHNQNHTHELAVAS